jgi:predicted hydrocarbon binding protein
MGPESESKESEANRIEYLLERNKRGNFLYSNFQAIRNVGVSPYKKIIPVRPELGDYEHIASFSLRFFSFLYLSPVLVYELYRLGKIIGYCTTDGALKTLKIKPLVNALTKTGLFWRVFQNKRITEVQRDGWKVDGGGLIELIEIDKGKGGLRYAVRENSCAIIKTLAERYEYEYMTKPCSCVEIGVLCGQAEALFGGLWDGKETRCMAKGDPNCEVDIHLHEGEVHPDIPMLTKEEYEELLDMGVKLAISDEKKTERDEMGDLLMISISQSVNYLLLSTSKGHIILSRWAGRKVGEKIIKKTRKDNLFDALDYLRDLFRDMKMAIIEYELNPDAIVIKMRESVYSSGVKNINMKLCIFLAGMVEGAFIEATGEEWIVTETKCTANGDPQCEFECKTEDPELLNKLLLG